MQTFLIILVISNLVWLWVGYSLGTYHGHECSRLNQDQFLVTLKRVIEEKRRFPESR